MNFKPSNETITITAENVDLTNCDKEQIHIPASIQPHGGMVILDPTSFTIVQVSQNIQAILHCDHTNLVGLPVSEILTPEQIQQLQNCLDHDFSAINPIRITLNNTELNLVIHQNQGFIFLEFEPINTHHKNDFITFYNMTKKIVDQIQVSASLQDLSEIIVKNIREITGFDRVMVYRFDQDGCGHVIAEDKLEHLSSFYGLRYPATDVPKPARRLYRLNYTRLISDIEAQQVPLPSHPKTHEPFDLSYAILRSVSPIHIEYLKNMGVRASMSISLIYENHLWGLIACHHYRPKYLPYEVRAACEFLGKVMSLNLIAKEDRESLTYKMEIKDRLSQLFETLAQTVDISESLYENLDLLRTLVRCDGVAICLNGQLKQLGLTPDVKEIEDLVTYLSIDRNRDLFYTDRLPQIYPLGNTIQEIASGVMILFLSRIEQAYIIWFRPEVSQTVHWAGNPNKDIKVEKDGTLTLSPRKSFDLWKQTVMGQSLPWLSCEIQQIMEFRNLLVDIIFKKSNELIEMNVELQKSNTELDAFAYSASHDLKEPLRGIYNYSYLLLEDYADQLDSEGSRKLNTLMSLTKRMEKLIDALLYYSRLGRQELCWETVDVDQMIAKDICMILESSQQEEVDIRLAQKMPVIKADKTLVEEVFINLISNGLKYNSSPNKWIEVGYLEDFSKSKHPIFYVRDNGIGIEDQHHEMIFRIFKRLHGQSKFGGGTGAGLTIVKKIIERHGGKIWLESTYGLGTTFFFTLAEE